MRRHGRRDGVLGWAAIAAGCVILLSMILPPGFWWFMLGVALISVGLCIKRRC